MIEAPARNGHVAALTRRRRESVMRRCPSCGSEDFHIDGGVRHHSQGSIRWFRCHRCRELWATVEVSVPGSHQLRRKPWRDEALGVVADALQLWRARPRPSWQERRKSQSQARRDVLAAVAAKRRGMKRRRHPVEMWRDIAWAERQIGRLDGSEPFDVLLFLYRIRTGRSRNALAKQISCDPSYLCRIEWAQRGPPRRYIVMALALALQLSDLERDRLLVAGGHSPESLVGIGWTTELHDAAMLAKGRVR